MKMTEAQGKTVSEAIENALKALNLTKEMADITILDEGSKGFLGIGQRPARVLLTEKLKSQIEAQKRAEAALAQASRIATPSIIEEKQAVKPIEKPKAAPEQHAQQPVERQKPAPLQVQADKPKTTPQQLQIQPQPQSSLKSATPAAPKARQQDSTQRPMQRKQPERPNETHSERQAQGSSDRQGGRTAQPRRQQPRQSAAMPPQKPGETRADHSHIKERTPQPQLAPSEQVALCAEASDYLQEILRRMDVSVGIDCKYENDGLRLSATGHDAGTLIGYRGETLDALQYLVSLKVNSGDEASRQDGSKGYQRVTLDAENYRAKREETLVKLAHRLAHKAIKTGKKVTLEPMNPYERRILHNALQSNSNVRTHSEGEDPYRRVIISPKRENGGREQNRTGHSRQQPSQQPQRQDQQPEQRA